MMRGLTDGNSPLVSALRTAYSSTNQPIILGLVFTSGAGIYLIRPNDRRYCPDEAPAQPLKLTLREFPRVTERTPPLAPP